MNRLNEIVTHLVGMIDAGRTIPVETNPIIVVAMLQRLTKRGVPRDLALELLWQHWQRFETKEMFQAEIERTSELIDTLVIGNTNLGLTKS